MSFYLWTKLLHLVAAIVMVGTSNANGVIRLYVNRHGEVWLVAAGSRLIMMLNRRLMVPSLLLLPATGVVLALTARYPLLSGWILAGELGTVLLWVLFLGGVVLERKMELVSRDAFERGTIEIPEAYRSADRWGLVVGLSATIVELGVLFIMVFRSAASW